MSCFRTELVSSNEAKTSLVVLDVIMTTVGIDRCLLKRVLVDPSASKDILYYRCFKEMRMNDHYVTPSSTALARFASHKSMIKRTDKLDVTLRTNECV